jgi:hypothetical protein
MKQLHLNFEPYTTSEIYPPQEITELVDEYKDFLHAIHVRTKNLAKIISCPDRFWQVKRLASGRICYIPHEELKSIQKVFDKYLKYQFYSHPYTRLIDLSQNNSCKEFDLAGSIIVNAKAHRKSKSSLMLDIRNAFEIITINDVESLLKKMFNLNNEISYIICRCTTYKNKLRAGSPISPFLFNRFMFEVDNWIEDECNKNNIIYTRYADNLCFSSPETIFPPEAEKDILEAISYFNIPLNERKTLRGNNGILEFPGVVIVRGRIRPTSRYVKKFIDNQDKLTNEQLKGHQDYLRQFGHNGKLRRLNIIHSKTPRSIKPFA